MGKGNIRVAGGILLFAGLLVMSITVFGCDTGIPMGILIPRGIAAAVLMAAGGAALSIAERMEGGR